MCQHQATASDLPFYIILAPQKIPLSKFLMTLLHVICNLASPPTPIKNPGYAYEAVLNIRPTDTSSIVSVWVKEVHDSLDKNYGLGSPD